MNTSYAENPLLVPARKNRWESVNHEQMLFNRRRNAL